MAAVSPQKSLPKDALVMQAILKDMNISDYEPRLVNQMLEFTYRYVTNILEDAKVYSTHAKKKSLDNEDVKLAIQMQMDKSFTTPPPRDLLVEIAKQRNSVPLPLLKPQSGPRLPPDRYCLLASNYKLKTHKPKSSTRVQLVPASRLNIGSLSSVASVVTTGTKSSPAVNVGNKTALSVVTKGTSSPTVAIVTRPASKDTSSKQTTPVPMFRISQGNVNTEKVNSNVDKSNADTMDDSSVQVKTEEPLKRKREDDDYDAS